MDANDGIMLFLLHRLRSTSTSRMSVRPKLVNGLDQQPYDGFSERSAVSRRKKHNPIIGRLNRIARQTPNKYILLESVGPDSYL